MQRNCSRHGVNLLILRAEVIFKQQTSRGRGAFYPLFTVGKYWGVFLGKPLCSPVDCQEKLVKAPRDTADKPVARADTGINSKNRQVVTPSHDKTARGSTLPCKCSAHPFVHPTNPCL